MYQSTAELLKYLGVTNVTDLPNYKKMDEELNKFESENMKNEEGDTANTETNI